MMLKMSLYCLNEYQWKLKVECVNVFSFQLKYLLYKCVFVTCAASQPAAAKRCYIRSYSPGEPRYYSD